MRIYHLEAAKPLTKKFTKLPDGRIEKSSYLHAAAFTSHVAEVATIADFFTLVKHHAELGHCLVKGELNRQLIDESRAGATNTDSATEWVCLDVDGLPATYTIEQLMTMMGLSEVSYVVQWSASQNIFNTDLRCHIFLLLDRPTMAPQLKQWLIQLNHTIQFLRENTRLTATHNGLSWPLDITTCQNDKLLYTAPPVLEGIKSPLGRKPRYELIKKLKAKYTLPTAINTAEANRLLTEARTNELRAKLHLEPRKFAYKTYKDVQVMVKPGEATITGIKQDRGFVYFNLNGGDSWAYYHPEETPEIIYSFKGETAYITKDLLPDYWESAKKAADKLTRAVSGSGAHETTEASQDGHPITRVRLAFQDKRTSSYYRGTFDPDTDVLDIDKVGSEKQVRDFCMQHNVPMGDYIPIWDKYFDPTDTVRVDLVNKTINTFQQTEYMRNVSISKQASRCPPTIMKLIHHVLGSDVAITEHYINWLAHIVQNRTRTETAWLLWGIEGTGKGQWVKRVLRPLFGTNQVAVHRVDELMGVHNGFLQDKMLLVWDEVQISALRDPEVVLGKLRNLITEDTISLRAMRSEAVNTPNYSNSHFLSNKPDAITLNTTDRRYNVGKYQLEKIQLTEKEWDESIPSELQAFYNYLAAYPVDDKAARLPLETSDRTNLIATTVSSGDDVAAAIKTGDLAFFLDGIPTDDIYKTNAIENNQVENYKAALVAMLRRVKPSGESNVGREELWALFDRLVGNVPKVHRFTSYLRHRHLHIEVVGVEGKVVRGLKIQWAKPNTIPAALKQLGHVEKVSK